MIARYTVTEFLLTYGSWQSLMQRMVYRSASRKDHALYRGRGIKICERWKRFENFIADMGARPAKNFSLDRHPDKDGNYEPGNCRWATSREQAANTRSAILLEHEGLTLPIAEWGRRLKLNRSTIQFRLKLGWSVAQTLTTPPNTVNPNYITFANGRRQGKKFSAAQVEELVSLARNEQWTATALGLRYGVSSTAVRHVAKQFGIKFKKGRPKCSTK